MNQNKDIKAVILTGASATDFGDGSYEDAFASDQMKMGMLRVPPHGTAGFDAGHPGKDEVFYVVQGTANVSFPTLTQDITITAGDFLPVVRTEPHVVTNAGDSELLLLYANCDV